jgi:outer membrane protein OmpA-like peptidoglycan-associated protein
MAGEYNQWLRQPLLLTVPQLLLAVLSLNVQAQAPLPAGDGIRGDYYEGTNFEKYVLTRRDATINFNWGHQPPATGMPAEEFSVRWTGWLVPPVSGKYVFHVTVDDGVRLWLNDKQLLNEWRGQPLSDYTAAVELRAGEPYHLRVDYCQYGLDTRIFITWERPDVPLKKPDSSWRNFWGKIADTPKLAPIPTSFLFSRNPPPPSATTPKPAAQQPKQVLARAIPAPAVVATRPAAVVPKPVRRPASAPQSVAAADNAAPSVAPVPVSAPTVLLADSGSTASLSALAVGGTVTLPELYFDQGKAVLLPPVRTALDALAAALRSRPELRFEVQGHTDNVGNAELNRQLSQQRADVVCLYLTAHGVATAQLQPKGYGGTQPVADNADPAQRPRNRRVVLRRL